VTLFVLMPSAGGMMTTHAPRWEIRDGGHTSGVTAHPREYEARVIAFLDRSL
jgi:hypothetical protein